MYEVPVVRWRSVWLGFALLAASCGDDVVAEDADFGVADTSVPRDVAGPDVAAPDVAMMDIAMCQSGCPNGCCDPQGICQAQSAQTCGSGGKACIACDATLA